MNNKKLLPFFIILVLAISGVLVFSFLRPSYSRIMSKSVKKVFSGVDFRKYKCPGFPTNNFGILTTYTGKVSPGTYYCSMLNCFDNLQLTNETDSLNLGGLADVGMGPAINLSDANQNRLSVKALLPKIWAMTGLETRIGSENVTDVSLDFGPTCVRNLNRRRFEGFINQLPDNDPYKIRYNNGNLAVIVADVVVKDMSVNINLRDTTMINLDSFHSLTNDTLNVQCQRKGQGKYSFKISQPLIVLRLARKQPVGGVLSINGSDDFSDWKIARDEAFLGKE